MRVLRIKLVFLPIYTQHNQGLCRCLSERLALYVVTKYKPEVHIEVQRGDSAMQPMALIQGQTCARQHTRLYACIPRSMIYLVYTSHTTCKYEFRINLRSHSCSVF